MGTLSSTHGDLEKSILQYKSALETSQQSYQHAVIQYEQATLTCDEQKTSIAGLEQNLAVLNERQNTQTYHTSHHRHTYYTTLHSTHHNTVYINFQHTHSRYNPQHRPHISHTSFSRAIYSRILLFNASTVVSDLAREVCSSRILAFTLSDVSNAAIKEHRNTHHTIHIPYTHTYTYEKIVREVYTHK